MLFLHFTNHWHLLVSTEVRRYFMSDETKVTQEYGAEQIQVLEGLEAVRKRPGSAGVIRLNSCVKGIIITLSTPSASSRYNFSSVEESSRNPSAFPSVMRGCGSKVRTILSPPSLSAIEFTTLSSTRCPQWTPSNDPMVATAHLKGGRLSKPLKTFISIVSCCYSPRSP